MGPPRLVFVTGKGGTGKSTCAAALALHAARRGDAVLADLDSRLSAARVLDTHPDVDHSTTVSERLRVMALSPRHELEGFIERIVPLRALSRRMLKSHTFGYVTAALPGLEAFLMLERLRIVAGEMALGDGYAIVDGPATGGALELLRVAESVRTMAPLGTLNRLAEAINGFLGDPHRFGVVLTVVPEESALREAIETATVVRDELKIPNVTAFLNRIVSPLFTAAELERARGLGEIGRLAAQREASAAFAARARRELTRARLKVIELPMMFRSRMGRRELAVLGRAMAGYLDA